MHYMLQCVFTYIMFLVVMEGVKNTAMSLFSELVGTVFYKVMEGFSQASGRKYTQDKVLMPFITLCSLSNENNKGSRQSAKILILNFIRINFKNLTIISKCKQEENTLVMERTIE